MANRQLTQQELGIANELLADLRQRIATAAGDDTALAWALRRKIQKELGYDERGKPTHRKMLKLKLRIKQGDKCVICAEPLPERGAVLDRIEAMAGYTEANTRLLCPSCDGGVQEERGYA